MSDITPVTITSDSIRNLSPLGNKPPYFEYISAGDGLLSKFTRSVIIDTLEKAADSDYTNTEIYAHIAYELKLLGDPIWIGYRALYALKLYPCRFITNKIYWSFDIADTYNKNLPHDMHNSSNELPEIWFEKLQEFNCSMEFDGRKNAAYYAVLAFISLTPEVQSELLKDSVIDHKWLKALYSQ